LQQTTGSNRFLEVSEVRLYKTIGTPKLQDAVHHDVRNGWWLIEDRRAQRCRIKVMRGIGLGQHWLTDEITPRRRVLLDDDQAPEMNG
jgi:hypothetical protein